MTLNNTKLYNSVFFVWVSCDGGVVFGIKVDCSGFLLPIAWFLHCLRVVQFFFEGDILNLGAWALL